MELMKRLQESIKHIKTMFYNLLAVSFKKKLYNNEDIILMNHLENTGNCPNRAWKRFWVSLKHPMVVMPIIGAFLILTIGYIATNGFGFWGELTKLLSVILVGIGINHFTTIFKELKEYQLLKFKGETTIKIIDLVVNEILNKGSLDVSDLNNLDKYANIVLTWLDYYPDGERILMNIHRKAKKDTSIETNRIKVNRLESLTEKIELNRQKEGSNTYFQISGGTMTKR